jgi:GAF domain-containing protein
VYNVADLSRNAGMKLVRHIDSARELLEEARRLSDATRLGDHAKNLLEAIGTVDAKLVELRSVCDGAEARIAVLEIIASERDPEQALVASLEYLTDRLGVDASGLRLRDGDDFPYFTTAGFSKEFVLAESSLCQRDHSGAPVRDDFGTVVLECMCGNVVQHTCDPTRPFFTSRGSFWTNSTSALLEETTEDDRLGRTRTRCHGEGYESVALIPMSSHDETFGLLQFNDHEAGKFTPQTIALLEDLAFYLARLLA